MKIKNNKKEDVVEQDRYRNHVSTYGEFQKFYLTKFNVINALSDKNEYLKQVKLKRGGIVEYKGKQESLISDNENIIAKTNYFKGERFNKVMKVGNHYMGTNYNWRDYILSYGRIRNYSKGNKEIKSIGDAQILNEFNMIIHTLSVGIVYTSYSLKGSTKVVKSDESIYESERYHRTLNNRLTEKQNNLYKEIIEFKEKSPKEVIIIKTKGNFFLVETDKKGNYKRADIETDNKLVIALIKKGVFVEIKQNGKVLEYRIEK